MATIRELLNRVHWDLGRLAEVTVSYRHRASETETTRSVEGTRIAEICAAGLRLDSEDEAIASEMESGRVGALAEDCTPAERAIAWLPYSRVSEVRLAEVALFSEGAVIPELATVLDGMRRDLREVAAPEQVFEAASVELPKVVLERGDDGTLTIDGSAGEGGGQIVRSSLTLSLLTNTPIRLVNIRKGRRKPGLMRQHLTCVQAAAAIAGIPLGDLRLGTESLDFDPRSARPDHAQSSFRFDIGSAGSVALVAQTILLPLALRSGDGPREVTITGGTHAQWAPIFEGLAESWIPLHCQMGLTVNARLVKHGFYPAGGGEIVLSAAPGRLTSLELARPLGAFEVGAHAIVANLPEKIAKREVTLLGKVGVSARIVRSVESRGPGNACYLRVTQAADDNGFALIFSSIGDRGKSAKKVAADVRKQYTRWLASGAAVDEFLADQLVIPVALAGGTFTASALSRHTRTNLAVAQAFVGKPFELEQSASAWRIRMRLA